MEEDFTGSQGPQRKLELQTEEEEEEEKKKKKAARS
jgi:hypothetical protein